MTRASFSEVLDFANKVREAGGANPLDALMPAVPEDSSQCLIARNLNFNCTVRGAIGFELSESAWVMEADESVCRRIADALGLQFVVNDLGIHAVVLPEPIAQVAADFDAAMRIFGWLDDYIAIGLARPSPSDLDLLSEMWPYIDAATREAYKLAGDHITPEGKIVL